MKDPAPSHAAPDADLLARIGPLPIQGRAWGPTARGIAWLTLIVLAFQIVRTALRVPTDAIDATLAGTVLFCFVGLAAMVWFMHVSVTTIDARGLRQTWITRREVAWEEIQHAKFVPMLLSKRLVVFRRGYRPVVFQGSTLALQKAFAHIALAHRRTT